MSGFVLHTALWIKDSKKYQRLKTFLFDLIINPYSDRKTPFDVVIMGLVVSSVFLLIYRVREPLPHWADVFESLAILLFGIEYLLRLWLISDVHKTILEYQERALYTGRDFKLGQALGEAFSIKLKYIRTPMAIIDLLAIIPAYRPLRILRIFLLFRVFKLFRYASSIQQFTRVFAEKKVEFETLFMFIGFVIFSASSAIYVLETNIENSQIKTYFDAVYWSLVTISTVGYGDITPVSHEGKVVTIFLILAGIGVISFFTSIVVTSFGEKMKLVRQSQHLKNAQSHSSHILICGYGRVGKVTAKLFRNAGRHVTIVEQNEAVAEEARLDGFVAVTGDASDDELLEKLGVWYKYKQIGRIKKAHHSGNVTHLLCLGGSDSINAYIALSARRLKPDIHIISRLIKPENENRLLRAGVNELVASRDIAGQMAAKLISSPVAYEAIADILSSHSDFKVENIFLEHISKTGLDIVASLNIEKYRLILLGVIRERDEESEIPAISVGGSKQFYFKPDSSFVLKQCDLLIVLGHRYGIEHFKDDIANKVLIQ
ncbi:MAG: ion transporter [bacterium]